MFNKLRRLQFLKEVLVVVILLFVYNNFLYKKNPDRKEVVINADGRGYYEYLPAFFIYDDIRFSYIDTLQTEFYEVEHTKLIYDYLENGQRINKYFVGTAVLQAPFFLIAHFIASGEKSIHPPDGFSLTYQRGILYAAIFYLFLGFVCIRLLLQTYGINGWWIFLIQSATLFATPLLNYTLYDPAYSHIYSFFLISWFLYAVRNYFLSNQSRYLILSLVVIGLIAIVRPVNVLIVIFTPLLTENFGEYLQKVKLLLKKQIIPFLIGLFLFGLIVSIQLYISFLQTGNPFSYNYGDEGFNFLHPKFIPFLFSYHKGFFLWTPWWFLVFAIGMTYYGCQKKYYRIIVFTLSFIVLTYVLSSWHAWTYGGSIGSRPMIDFYGAFILLFIPVFTGRNKIGRWLLTFIFPVLAVVMQVQIFQYQRAIIHWDGMNKERYWEVFLNTNEKYTWYFWKTEFKVGEYQRSQVLFQELDTFYPSEKTELPVVEISTIDSLSVYGELTLHLEREADKEFMEIWLLDSLSNEIYYTLERFFFHHQGNSIVYRFSLPDNKMQIHKLKLLINKIDSPLKINSITFSTYNSLN